MQEHLLRERSKDLIAYSMNKIHKLSLHEAQKIAAGEVVERPANVVKELVENALDAGATDITIYIEQGGKKRIRVTDNGCGMSPADARMCIEQHATSKITSVDQLETLETFGFRGEALSSIASVSTLTLITKLASAIEATKLVVSLGKITEQTITSAPTGTDITIDNLFDNVPARKKFLKTDETERRAITQLFQAFCFAYPNIRFILNHNDEELYNCPPGTSKQRVQQLFDTRMYTHMHEAQMQRTEDSIQVDALFSDHQYTRYDRSALFFFVNKRWVKNYKLSQAFIKAYANVLPPGKYPAGIVSITLDPRAVDINIHPRKEEVQFLHPRLIETTLTECVKKGLEAQLTHTIAPAGAPAPRPIIITAPKMHQELPVMPIYKSHEVPAFQVREVTQVQVPIQTVPETTNKVIGQIHATYILIETDQGMSLVDQHAAHERILYEQFSARFHEVATVQLLFPQVITLKEDDLALILAHDTLFKNHGILFEQTSAQHLVITSVPVPYKDHSLQELIQQVIAWSHELFTIEKELFFKKITERLRAQMACKSAVKAGDVLTQEKMVSLLEMLARTENNLTCPHGRPTHWTMSLVEIQKIFKRT